MRTAILLIALIITGCSWSNNLGNYKARFTDADGADYTIFNRKGALLEIEKPDGTKIIADDRGHTAQPGFLSQATTLLLLRGSR